MSAHRKMREWLGDGWRSRREHKKRVNAILGTLDKREWELMKDQAIRDWHLLNMAHDLPESSRVPDAKLDPRKPFWDPSKRGWYTWWDHERRVEIPFADGPRPVARTSVPGDRSSLEHAGG